MPYIHKKIGEEIYYTTNVESQYIEVQNAPAYIKNWCLLLKNVL